ncbi:MAG: hypothetical protein JO069_01865 [Verrucomicrobia bacterium]|nr:hypothetical protein [Verrucomicrobiota bacterium]
MDELPRFVRDLIASFPQAGNGVHRHLFRLVRYLHALRSEPEIFALMRAASDGCGRKISDRELHDAILNSKRVAWRPAGTAQSPAPSRGSSAWPARQHTRINELVRRGAGLYELWEASPVRLEFDATPEASQLSSAATDVRSESTTERIIDTLFPGNPLLCVARSAMDFATRRRERWRGHLSRCGLMVPSPMARVYGQTRDGKMSQHALAAVGPRRFLVVEFDFSEKARDGVTDSEWARLVRAWRADGIGAADACAALLAHLAEYAPLTLAVHSGGKSVHGWFYAAGNSDDRLRRFMAYAHALGADPATWSPHQFVRMPDGTRENGRPQPVYFFNPGSLP